MSFFSKMCRTASWMVRKNMDGLISSSKNAHLSSFSRKPSVGEQNQSTKWPAGLENEEIVYPEHVHWVNTGYHCWYTALFSFLEQMSSSLLMWRGWDINAHQHCHARCQAEGNLSPVSYLVHNPGCPIAVLAAQSCRVQWWPKVKWAIMSGPSLLGTAWEGWRPCSVGSVCYPRLEGKTGVILHSCAQWGTGKVVGQGICADAGGKASTHHAPLQCKRRCRAGQILSKSVKPERGTI